MLEIRNALALRILTCAVLLGIAAPGAPAVAQSNDDAMAQMNQDGQPQQGAQGNPICIRLEGQLATIDRGAGTGDPAAGRALLMAHRAGLELLRLALRDVNSPWADVLDSVSATLPPLAGGERDAVARLAAKGPPEEQVGLAPFAPPDYMPAPRGDRR